MNRVLRIAEKNIFIVCAWQISALIMDIELFGKCFQSKADLLLGNY